MLLPGLFSLSFPRTISKQPGTEQTGSEAGGNWGTCRRLGDSMEDGFDNFGLSLQDSPHDPQLN
jgi:hypothetical protein